MPADDSQVRAALGAVEDPALGHPIGELGELAAVTVADGAVRVQLALPLPEDGWPSEPLVARVEEVLAALPEVTGVQVERRAMTEPEAAAAARVLRGEPPPNPLTVLDAAAAATPRPRRNPFTDASTRVLAVASGKGGVGKSSVSANLAVTLARRGQRVAAVDADVYGFSLPRMLGVDHPPGVIDDVIIPPSAHGVRLVSMGFFAREDQAVIWRGPMLHKALEQFLTDVHWAEPDFLVVDMPPGTGDVSISLGQLLPRAEAVIVTTPQPLAQEVAARAALMAQKTDMRVIGVVENMTSEVFGEGGGAGLAGALGVPLLGTVPLDLRLREAGDSGEPLVWSDPEAEAARAIVAVAEAIEAARQTFKPLPVLS